MIRGLVKSASFQAFVIFVFNIGLKLICIGCSPLWYDEIISVKDTLLDFGHIKHEAEWDKNPPFYHYLLWVWSYFFGISESAVRSMSAFFSALSAVVLFFLLKKLRNERIAWLGTLIFTAHPFLMFYAQEARCYSVLLFLAFCNSAVLLNYFVKPKLAIALILGLLNFLLFYTHYLAGLIICVQTVFLFWSFRKRIVWAVGPLLLMIILVLIRFTPGQYRVLFFSGKMSAEKQNVPLSNLSSLLEALNDLFLHPILAIIFLLGVCYVLYRGRAVNPPNSIFINYLFCVPILSVSGLYLIGQVEYVFHSRYLFFTLAFIIPVSFLLLKNRVLTLIISLIVLAIEIYEFDFGTHRGMDYRLAAKVVSGIEKQHRAKIVLQTPDVLPVFLYYYDRNSFIETKGVGVDKVPSNEIYTITKLTEIQSIRDPSDSVILFMRTYHKEKGKEAIAEYFPSDKFQIASTKSIPGVEFYCIKRY